MSSRPSPSHTGRPPFATDEPDSAYEQRPPPPKLRVPKPANPNDRTSAYDVYDHYLEDDNRNSSAIGGIGEDFMNGDYSDSEDEDDHRQPRHLAPQQSRGGAHPQQQQPPPTLNVAQPRPGYAIPPTSPLRINPPKPIAVPEGRTQAADNSHGAPQGQGRIPPQHLYIPPRDHSPPTSPGPSLPPSPHPLQAPMTPITPVFARPAKPSTPRPNEVKFETGVIRGNSEDALLPRRGEKGDDFWRRFSVVAHDEKGKPSTWLHKTQSGTHSLSRWVWCIGLVLLIAIAGASVLGWWVTRHNNANRDPTTFGGAASEANSATTHPASSVAVGGASTPLVHPTLTINNRRDVQAFATAAAVPAEFNSVRNRHIRSHEVPL